MRKWAIASVCVAALTAASVARAAHQPGFGHSNPLVAGQQTLTSCSFGLGPCLSVDNSGTDGTGVAATGATGVSGSHTAATGAGPGVLGQTQSTDTNAAGVLGRVTPTSVGDFSAGVRGINNGTGGVGAGVIGEHAGTGAGVFGQAGEGFGVYGKHASGIGTASGVFGETFSSAANASGVRGRVIVGGGPGSAGVLGENFSSFAANTAGVLGTINSAAANAAGVRGQNTHASCCGMGVAGFHDGQGIGVYGESLQGFAVSGFSPNNWSGYFQGNMRVVGNLQKNSGSFTIDHPLDPENKYLSHSFVESPDMKNVYDGVVRTNSEGFAVVRLPSYFQALNRDFRYQLTAIGQPTLMWIAKKIANHRFTIRTDEANVEVSWQVTGIRKDAWANAHRIKVEELKRPAERGKYLNPELFGRPAAKSVVVLPGMRTFTERSER